ncbi:TetR/AcrR family transcriptional regulator C-terminal domain-containing protein [Umezawaea sp. Da 62-37]|uniref:TetR/AcrR family transcriptional regulator n=1 Tax=Umezawaea sp. Da 62-37 TaxID=3075927 RepID=UPI0028F74E2F|nr:TetR/AcrR family transcriptional regulator C-terminal domain-containing protein [Umezawaea sp. Da 62-37]WNV86920.1 TetR/AcrR family transcriptional regulator C-terminal domain-containing protein [Umezawaea sp. Da 62-37]
MPSSPRTSPAKAPLSRDAIVSTTLALVDELGFGAVSMRRVSQALDTGPASLYVYVRDRQELMALAHDLAMADVELPTDSDGDWRARLELLVDRVVDALGSHDDIASLGLSDVPVGAHSLRVTEEMLRLLGVGGIDDAACAWAADLLGQYIASSALEKAARLRAQRDLARAGDTGRATEEAMSEAFSARLDTVYRSLPASQYPTISVLAPLLTGGEGDARAAWKLRVIIDGLLAQGVRV